MGMMPIGLLLGWVSVVFAFGLLGGGSYLIWGWYQGVLVGTAYLISGIGVLTWALLGRSIVLLLRPAIADEPTPERSLEVQRLSRPDGTQIQTEWYGKPGAPVLLITHGWGTDSTELYYAKEHLAQDFRLLLWDLPGLGKSKGPSNGDYRLEKMAEDLKAVLDTAPEGPVVLAGHSIGGMITQTFCRLYPEYLEKRVSGLVLIHTTYMNPVRTSALSGIMAPLQKLLLEPLCWLAIALSPLIQFANFLSFLNGSAHINAWISGFAGSQSRGQLDFSARFQAVSSPSVISRGMLAMFRFDATETLPKIRVPVLVVCGMEDPTTQPEASFRIKELLPNAELVKLTPGSHMGHMERHPEFVDAVREFVQRRMRETDAVRFERVEPSLAFPAYSW